MMCVADQLHESAAGGQPHAAFSFSTDRWVLMKHVINVLVETAVCVIMQKSVSAEMLADGVVARGRWE
jgi:hypothetical protein